MADLLKREKDWSPLCEACLARTKSSEFRETILERSKPLEYNINTDNLMIGCVICSLVIRQLEYKEKGSSSRPSIAEVKFSSGSPSEVELSVNNHHSLLLHLYTRPGETSINVSYLYQSSNMSQRIPRLGRSPQSTNAWIRPGRGDKPANGYQRAFKAIVPV